MRAPVKHPFEPLRQPGPHRDRYIDANYTGRHRELQSDFRAGSSDDLEFPPEIAGQIVQLLPGIPDNLQPSLLIYCRLNS